MASEEQQQQQQLQQQQLPRCKILLRSKDGVELYEVPDERNNSTDAVIAKNPTTEERRRPFLIKGLTTIPLLPAPDGSCVYAHLSGYGIVKHPIIIIGTTPAFDDFTAATRAPASPYFANTTGVQMMDLSPKGTYLLTWERWYEDKCPHNLKLWETSTGKLVGAFMQKALRRDAWPYLQWTFDESVAALHATNEVRFYPPTAFTNNDSGDPSGVRFAEKIRITGISSMSLPRQGGTATSAGGSVLFTAFIPGTKDKPARACLYEYRPGGKTSSSSDQAPLLSKSLFQAEEMKVHWSPAGDAALITLQTSVDASGQSYYGSSQLFLLRKQTNPKDEGIIAVPLPQEGPVQDVAWLPDPSKPPCFAVIAGKMPAMASLHHGITAKATFLFGNTVHRNTIAWAPHGRFLCTAGYGNLSGGMSFWDRNKLKLTAGANNVAGHCKAEAVVGYGWSPDSRLFYCSTCTPRMNVDNGVRLFRYNGDELPQESLPWNNEHYRPDKLLEACFVPAPSRQFYPDRPQSPPPEGVSSTATDAPVKMAAAPAAKPAGRYVPPSQRNKVGGAAAGGRGRGGGSSLAERMRREKEGKSQTATRVVDKQQPTGPQGRVVVGMAPAPAKSKSALKREKMKQKKQQQAAVEATAAETPKEETAAAPAAAVDPEKRARKLKKTLKQIEDLKQKDPATLNDDQKAKIASKAELEAELASLQIN